MNQEIVKGVIWTLAILEGNNLDFFFLSESSDSSMLWVLIRMKANVVLGPSFYLYPILCLSAGTSWLKELLLSKSAK